MICVVMTLWIESQNPNWMYSVWWQQEENAWKLSVTDKGLEMTQPSLIKFWVINIQDNLN